MAGRKWSQDAYFPEGGNLRIGDQFVGLRNDANIKYTFSGILEDGNENQLVDFKTVGADATDYLEIYNGNAANNLKLEAVGDEDNISIDIVLKGTGVLNVTGLFDINGSTSINEITDDTTLADDSSTTIATEHAVKTYVDNNTGGGGVLTWNEITATSDTMVKDNGYISNNAGLVTLTLPSTCEQGKVVAVQGLGAGGWKIAQNAGQTINFGSSATTAGTGGSLASTNRYDSVWVLCVTANTTFCVLGAPQGTLTVV
jgi:hypothetical protein